MLMVLAVVIWVAPALSSATGEREGMPRIGPAPELSLTTQAGQRLSLTGLDANQVVMLGAAALSWVFRSVLSASIDAAFRLEFYERPYNSSS